MGDKVDILIANAGYVPQFDAYGGIGTLYVLKPSAFRPTSGSCSYFDRRIKPDELTQEFWKVFNINVLANIHLYNLFLPLVFKGNDKKVICISSGQADTELAKDYEIDVSALYSASKAAMNMITVKFHAQYKKDGILFMGICPGMVDVGHFNSSAFSLSINTSHKR